LPQRDGADRIAAEVQTMLELAPARNGWNTPVLKTVAREGEGIAAFVEAVDRHRAFLRDQPHTQAFRREYRKRWLIELILAELNQRLRLAANGPAQELLAAVAEGQLDPYSAAARILAQPELLRSLLERDDE
jgi:LAO/AO transport system kinase